MTFAEARARFPVLERIAYLNAGSFGPLSGGTVAAIEDEVRGTAEHGRGGDAYVQRMWELRARVRERVAATIGAPAGRVALTGSTTDGCNIVLAGLDLGREDEVVTTDTEHFGLLGPLIASGARIRVVRTSEAPAGAALDLLLAKVTPRTRLLAVSHVSWITGHVLDVAVLRRETGLPVLADGAQSAGAIPVEADVADFYTVSAQKWLCGPDATGALYVREPDALRVAFPSHFSQASHDRAAATYEPKAGAARFDAGWIPTPSLAGLEAALAGLPEWRFERAAETAARCRERLGERFEVVTEPGHATLVSFRPAGDPGETVARLAREGVVIRDLPGTGLLRVSCGWWTSDSDLDRLVAGLAR